MNEILQNEATAALRTITVEILDPTGSVGVTGISLTGGSPATLKICKYGGSAGSSAGPTLVELSGFVDIGLYALTFAAGDCDTDGDLTYEITQPGIIGTCRGFIPIKAALRSADISSGAVTAIQSGLAVPGSAMTLTGGAIAAVQAGLAVPGSAMTLTDGTLTAVATAILTSSLGAGHTVQGALRRMDWINIGKLTGGLSVLATFYQYDGSTIGVQATQDPVLGTRTAASTAAGD